VRPASQTQIPINTTELGSDSGHPSSTTVNDRQPPSTSLSDQPARPLPNPTQNREAIEGIARLQDKAKTRELSSGEKRELDQHEKTLATTRTYHLENEQKALSGLNPPRELHPTQAQKLENERAILQRPVPGEPPANSTHSSGGGQSQGSTATSNGDTPPTGHVTSTHNFDGGTDGTSGGSHTSDGVTPPGGSPGATGSSRTEGTSAPPQIGHGRLIPEDTTSPEHIDLARRRAANLGGAAAAGKLDPHEQSVYDNARRVLDRNAPAQGGTRDSSPPQGSRDKGNPQDVVMAGGAPQSQTATHSAEAPPAAVPAQAKSAVGTTIEGSGATNPDAPRASAGGAVPPPQGGQGGHSTSASASTAAQSPGGNAPTPGNIGGNSPATSGSAATAGGQRDTSAGTHGSSTHPASLPSGKQHISGGVPELPEGAKLLDSSEHWFIFEHGGKKWVRFYAPEARSPNTAKKGGRGGGDDDTAAFLTPERKIYVDEGQHRLNAVALEGKTTISTVPKHPKWLEYEYKGPTNEPGERPAYAPGDPHKSVNRMNDWDGEEGY
jgi:hypothetical protein